MPYICEVCGEEIDTRKSYITVGEIDEITGEPKEGAKFYHPECYEKLTGRKIIQSMEIG